LGSAYGFLQGAWPFGLVEAIWSVVALQRWYGARPRARGAWVRQEREVGSRSRSGDIEFSSRSCVLPTKLRFQS